MIFRETTPSKRHTFRVMPHTLRHTMKAGSIHPFSAEGVFPSSVRMLSSSARMLSSSARMLLSSARMLLSSARMLPAFGWDIAYPAHSPLVALIGCMKDKRGSPQGNDSP